MSRITFLFVAVSIALGMTPLASARADDLTPKFGVKLLFEDNTATVVDVLSGFPAEFSKIKPGDTILEFNGNPINTKADADAFLADCSKFTSVIYQRKSDNKKVKVELGSGYAAYSGGQQITDKNRIKVIELP